MDTCVSNLKPNIVTINLEANAAIEIANKYLSATTAMVVMDPYEAEALMRFHVAVFSYGLSAKADTLINTTTSLNFVSKEFVMAKCFYKYCKADSKLDIMK